MGNGIKPVAQTYYEISDVEHTKVKKPLDYSKDVFYLCKNKYTPKGMRPISVNGLGQLINEYKNDPRGKGYNRCLLKGLYKGGYNGENCYKGAHYLFFDIDVKDEPPVKNKNGKTIKKAKKENTQLFDPDLNQDIFRELRKVAVICWRSNSGNGIAGVLYVPQMGAYLNDKKDLHLKAGKAITSHLSQYLADKTNADPISFDQAQSNFRQARFLAEQRQARKLNLRPLNFSYKTEKKKKEYSPGVTVYKPKSYRNPYGSISAQFDSDNDILTVALNSGFKIVGSANGNEIRVKHPNTTSKTSGPIYRDKNIFYNHSKSLSPYEVFTPSQMVCNFQFNGDWGNFYKHLRDKGYKKRQSTTSEIKTASNRLKSNLKNLTDKTKAAKLIFKYCYDLNTLSNDQKQKFIKENCPRPELKKYFKAYLDLRDQKIRFDKRLKIKNYVAEVLPEVLDYADRHGKIILAAETGKGKSTAFIRDFHKHRPHGRILILEPLTIIVDQNEKEYKDKGVFLTGKNTARDHANAFGESLVMATYQQGIKQLTKQNFDYVILDEAHETITAQSYKPETISELTGALGQTKVIGLTGTPNQIFNKIGYKLLDIAHNSTKTPIEVCYSNKRPYGLAREHLRKVKGKAMIRVNSEKTIKSLKDKLIKNGLYSENEILILNSTLENKQSNNYLQLAHYGNFYPEIKLVLTTSMIDEGLSIRQPGFTDIIFIETSYIPRPEPAKQFFARFRNYDPGRKNYLYLKKTNDQTPSRLNENWLFDNQLKTLQHESEKIRGYGNENHQATIKTPFSNDAYFYIDYSVNLFFLGYSITEVFFRAMNATQFLSYLETNYNLEFTVNTEFDPDPVTYVEDKEFKAQIKKQIARVWANSKDEVLQVLAINSQDKGIRAKLKKNQQRFEPENERIILDNIKGFEKLYKRSEKLTALGVNDPDTILIKDDKPASNDHYKKQKLLLELAPAILEPKTDRDKKQAQKFIQFADWCESKKNFTYKQMFKQLRSLKIVNLKAYNEKMLFTVLEWFDLKAKRNRKNNILKVSKQG